MHTALLLPQSRDKSLRWQQVHTWRYFRFWLQWRGTGVVLRNDCHAQTHTSDRCDVAMYAKLDEDHRPKTTQPCSES